MATCEHSYDFRVGKRSKTVVGYYTGPFCLYSLYKPCVSTSELLCLLDKINSVQEEMKLLV